MSEEYINKITLEYLLNPNRLKNNNKILINNTIDKDIKFYRKRINQLTKDMLKGSYPTNNIKMIFENYVLHIISYFKQQDTKDIYQEEYSELSLKEPDIIVENNIENHIENHIENLFMNIKTKPIPTLENFVKRNNETSLINNIMPQKKKINIRDPQFRMKGVQIINNKEKSNLI
jgi:hypothetical protein